MNNHELVEKVADDIYDSFGGRQYSEIQKKVLLKLVEIYGQKNFRRVAMKLIEEGTGKPYPVHFKTQLQNLPADQKPKQKFEELEIRCKSCMETGYVFINDPDNEVIALCYCQTGMQKSEDLEKLPRMTLQTWGLVKPFPTLLFSRAVQSRPPQDELENSLGVDFWEKVEWWKNVKKTSQKYWNKK